MCTVAVTLIFSSNLTVADILDYESLLEHIEEALAILIEESDSNIEITNVYYYSDSTSRRRLLTNLIGIDFIVTLDDNATSDIATAIEIAIATDEFITNFNSELPDGDGDLVNLEETQAFAGM